MGVRGVGLKVWGLGLGFRVSGSGALLIMGASWQTEKEIIGPLGPWLLFEQRPKARWGPQDLSRKLQNLNTNPKTPNPDGVRASCISCGSGVAQASGVAGTDGLWPGVTLNWVAKGLKG